MMKKEKMKGMGGRGSSSGVSVKGKAYGTEYTTLHESGNIKFVRYNDSKSSKTPRTAHTMTEHYTVTKDADRLAPNWLASRINYKTIKLLYRDKDGHAELKGVKIGDEVAQIGDTVQFNGRRLSVGRR